MSKYCLPCSVEFQRVIEFSDDYSNCRMCTKPLQDNKPTDQEIFIHQHGNSNSPFGHYGIKYKIKEVLLTVWALALWWVFMLTLMAVWFGVSHYVSVPLVDFLIDDRDYDGLIKGIGILLIVSGGATYLVARLLWKIFFSDKNRKQL